ncbi:ejaculatory bulb-specific protein 3 [Amyelois transitella]|uniref:ejaculatory bulb-specific protein 3 n=1 Tax=Amyelois transitella TaxID=680683 RepID=UPI00298F9A29|nr:ejaculatory bulb-specific protein 3 [Amyelois transitella]
MKLYLLTILLIRCLFNIGVCEEPTYTTKYDGIDLDEILASDRLLAGYVNCLLDLGPCTPDGKELKNNLPDAIQSDCHKCSRKQREGSERVMEFIIDNKPDDWTKLEKKYNSDGSYKEKYMNKKKSLSEGKSDSKSEEDEKQNSKENSQ